ncbi:autotransporter domain-containing protein [Neisseriaceae bacterium PsAf]|nr:autotransporter domain-containing protein [Neisseriaceae bacterium PsAf]
MIIKKNTTQLTITVLLACLQNINFAGIGIGNDVTNTINAISDGTENPLDALVFAERRINEWSIGVFNPDYVPNFPQEDYWTKSSNYEFKQLVTFGDSLSDKGTHTRSTMFLAGGYHSKLYNDYLSEHYTGKSSVPNTYGGLNYAQSGASFKNRGDDLDLRHQIDQYLNDFGGVADPESIYILNAGGMDVNKSLNQIVTGLINGSYQFSNEFYTLDDAPKIAADDVLYLRDKGAKYIMIGNIPDASLSPYTPIIPIEFISGTLDDLHLPNFGLITHVGKLVDNYLRNPANQIPGTGKEFIRANGIHTLQSILWFIPHPAIINIYDFLTDIQKIPTEQFNRSLEVELSKIGGDVVFFDFRKLMDEMVDDYKSYGIDEILVPTCDLGFSARYCDYDSNRYHKDKVYLFGDWFHPSPETHFIISQYIQSIFDAPLYVTSISEHFSNINFSKNNFLESQLFGIKQITNKELNEWHLIAGYSGLMNDKNYEKQRLEAKKTYAHNINIGAYTFTSPEIALGFMFTTSLGKQKPFDNFRFNHFSETVTLFSQWSNDKGLWLNSMLDFGYMRVKDIERNIQLGAHQRTEKTSSTDAYAFGTNIKGGFDWINTNTIQSGPQAALNLNRINIKNFKEESDRSTAMHFESHHKNDFYAALGWYINSKDYQIGNTPTNFRAEINYNHTIGSEKTKIKGAVNSTLTSFTRELDNPKKWVNVKLDADFKVNQSGTINTNLNFISDNDKNRKLGYGIGYRYKF